MPTLPISLPAGIVAIYGIGVTGRTPSGMLIEENFRYGTVYNFWDGGASYVYGNDVVVWEDSNSTVRLATAGGTYTIVPARLVTKDSYVAPP